MVKEKEEIKEENEETSDEKVGTPSEEVRVVSLAQVPTEYGTVFRTPNGDLGHMEYLVWLGNMFLDFKAAIAGN